MSRESHITVERIDRAIETVARVIVMHDMPELMATIRHLEAERDRIQQETSAIDYAREILRRGRNIGSNIEERKAA